MLLFYNKIIIIISIVIIIKGYNCLTADKLRNQRNKQNLCDLEGRIRQEVSPEANIIAKIFIYSVVKAALMVTQSTGSVVPRGHAMPYRNLFSDIRG